MINKPNRNEKRKKRHRRARNKINGTSERPRLNVFKSLSQIYAQIIDDTKGHTIVSASTLDSSIGSKIKFGANKEAAKLVGKLVAERALENGVKSVVFDRGGYAYHGVIKELAESAREAGLNF